MKGVEWKGNGMAFELYIDRRYMGTIAYSPFAGKWTATHMSRGIDTTYFDTKEGAEDCLLDPTTIIELVLP